jgi:N-acyl-D-amino-acid deacylase
MAFLTRLLLAFSVVWFGTGQAIALEPFDVVLLGGKVVDGTGAPWFYADVGIRHGKIAAIGHLKNAKTRQSLNASGLIVAPGFVDMMGQTATPLLRNPQSAFNLLSQGVTTINAGEGVSAAPLDDKSAKTVGWKTMAQYFTLLEKNGLPINVVQSVGHSQVRGIVLGSADRRPTERELEKMKSLVREAMEAGATGLSTALIYPPAVYATTEEIAALAAVAGEYGGRYYTHMRNEGDRLLEAIDEALEIGRSAKTPVHIFHLKAAGKQNWPKMQQAIAKITAARKAGQQVTADIYPYINNGLGIAAFMHPRNFTRGRDALRRQLDDPQVRKRIRQEMETEAGWENWYRHSGFDWNKVVLGSMTAAPFNKHNGKTLAQIAKELKRDEWDTFFEIAKVGAFALPQSMSDANKILAMQQEFISFCTDVGPAVGGTRIASHPRAFGSFPRILGRYVREKKAISLEQAISKMSAVAMNEVMVYDRGRISVGLAADIVLFDFDTIADRATLAEPQRPSVGVKHVFVNGQLVFSDGKVQNAKPGKVLRGPGFLK